MSDTIGHPDPALDLSDGFKPHTSHWGVFSAASQGGRLVVKPHPGDPDPNPLLQNFPEALRHRARVARPMVRSVDRVGSNVFIAHWLMIENLSQHCCSPGSGSRSR